MPRSFKLLLLIALLIRLAFVPHPGFKADIAYWKWWGKASVEESVAKAYSYGNYPPIYMYILHATSWAYNLFAPLEDSYWHDTNYLYLLLIKFPYILADLGIGWLIYKILNTKFESPNKSEKLNSKNYRFLNLEFTVPQSKPWRSGVWNLEFSISSFKNMAVFASAVFLLNPAVIYNSAIWGQTDSLSAFAILLMYYFLLTGRYLPYAILIPINFFLKVQSLPFILLSLIFIAKREGLEKLFSTLIPTIPAAFVINLPHILSNNFPRVVGTMINSIGYFPYASLNAYNLHWLAIGGQSDRYPDTNLIFNLISHKSLGILLFGLCFSIIAIYLWKSLNSRTSTINSQLTGLAAGGSTLNSLSLSSLLAIFSSFLFMTEIHERYFFPIYMFGALLVGIKALNTKFEDPNKDERLNTKKFIFLNLDFAWNLGFRISNLAIYLLLSFSGLLNLHLVMIQNYPDNNLSFLNFLLFWRIPLSLVLSVLNLSIFLYLFFPLVREKVRLIGLICLIGPIFFIAQSLNRSPAISLTSLTPVSVSQDWGKLAINKSVNGNLLSPGYYFHRTGLGTHANSQIKYHLQGRYSRFTTGFGLDIESSDNGSAEFIIMLDDNVVYKSQIFRKWDKPGYVDIPLNKAQTLILITTDARDGKDGDHADWLEPTLHR